MFASVALVKGAIGSGGATGFRIASLRVIPVWPPAKSAESAWPCPVPVAGVLLVLLPPRLGGLGGLGAAVAGPGGKLAPLWLRLRRCGSGRRPLEEATLLLLLSVVLMKLSPRPFFCCFCCVFFDCLVHRLPLLAVADGAACPPSSVCASAVEPV